MSFNARSFNELRQLEDDNIESRIYEFVTKHNPDIVCFQEAYYAMKRNDAFRIVPGLNTIQNEESTKLFEKSRSVMLKQYEQASLIRENMEATSYKKIVVGDFNNTQYSNVYHKIKGDLNDSYLEKGKGFGRTYEVLKFPIRIDYILADPEFEVLSHQNYDERLSDHYPIMATLRLKSHQ